MQRLQRRQNVVVDEVISCWFTLRDGNAMHGGRDHYGMRLIQKTHDDGMPPATSDMYATVEVYLNGTLIIRREDGRVRNIGSRSVVVLRCHGDIDFVRQVVDGDLRRPNHQLLKPPKFGSRHALHDPARDGGNLGTGSSVGLGGS